MPSRPRIAIVSNPPEERGAAAHTIDALVEAFPEAAVLAFRSRGRRRSPDVTGFDVIVSAVHAREACVLTRDDQVHVCYVRTPPSHAWDAATQSRVHRFVASGTATQRWIATSYGRSSELVFPPIDTHFFTPGGNVGDYFLVASRAASYKRMGIAIAATVALGVKLKIVGGDYVIGDVPANVERLGRVGEDDLRTLMRGARALVVPDVADFEPTLLETNACGRPVIAFAAGDAFDTMIDGHNAIAVPEQSVGAFVRAIVRCEATEFEPLRIRDHALRFSRTAFIGRIRAIVDEVWASRTGLVD